MKKADVQLTVECPDCGYMVQATTCKTDKTQLKAETKDCPACGVALQLPLAVINFGTAAPAPEA